MPTNLRVTNQISLIEYLDDTNYRRLSNIVAMVEYYQDINYRRISNMMVMVEYIQNEEQPSLNKFGPIWQFIG